jgi:hypothetical protein
MLAGGKPYTSASLQGCRNAALLETNAQTTDALEDLQFASCKQLIRSDRPARNRVLFGEVKHNIEGA